MKLAVPKETVAGEHRIALCPEAIKRLLAKQFTVLVETEAGRGAHISDDELRAAGAEIVPDAPSLYAAADLVVKVQPPTEAELVQFREGSGVLSLLYPLSNPQLVEKLS